MRCVKFVKGQWDEGEHSFPEGVAFCAHCGRWKGTDMPKEYHDMAMPKAHSGMTEEAKEACKDKNLEAAALRRELHPSRIKGPTKQSHAALDKILK